ncbi:MAG TPA: formate dehydrogenase subunit gamma [Caulobacteraceae bacterium]|nr:formate dehydrogenase subunit gamma [Caulobacteraceae bacterium]
MSDPEAIERGDEILPGNPPRVVRYRGAARVNHWVTAAAMVLLILSGVAMFWPPAFFLTALLGGGQTARFLHPWIGVTLVVSFALLARQFWRGNLWNRTDVDWVAHMGDLVRGHEEKMPEVDKFNAGQKFIFWAMALLILAMLASGAVIWEEYFGGMTSIPIQREALLVHWLGASLIILVLILHIYAAVWVRGSFDAMIRGWVSAGWAWRHHRLWFRRLAARAAHRGDAPV